MGRNIGLTVEEQAKIRILKEEGYSNRSIAKKINRSPTVVCNFLNLGEMYGVKKRRGICSKLKDRQKRQIIRQAIRPNSNSTKIRRDLRLSVTTRRIRQVISQSGVVKWAKKQRKPLLSIQHKKARLRFAKKHVNWNSEWENVVFSDEKKFNLDGPDRNKSYWHRIGTKKQTSVSRNFGGGTVMVWGAFSSYGTTPICWITPKMNSSDYIELLDNVLLNYTEDMDEDSWIFQQDNATIHNSKATKAFFSERNIKVMDWPARSPDLNPIENIWGLITQKVYENGHFESVKDLKDKIREVWSNLSLSYIQKLLKSMPNRLHEVIVNNGGVTHY